MRKAAVESLGLIGGPAAASAALKLLDDPIWYVKAHAARALGDLGRQDLAGHVVPLLSDREWWVRMAAKESLLAMGEGAWESVVALLDHDDRFARNGAAEVLQNGGWLEEAVERAARGDKDETTREALRKAFSAGGARLVQFVAWRNRELPGLGRATRGAGARGGGGPSEMMPPPASLVALVYWGYLGCLVYLVGATLLYLSLALVAGVQALIRNREERAEDFDVIAASRFTIPVSVIAPAYNEEVIILAAVRSLLELEYPEHEVVVVNDGSTDRTLDLLKEGFELEPRQVFFRRVLPCREIRSIYRSKKEPRLVVVDKENGGKADAMNCGVNLSRYRYVCCVDADTFYAPDALLKTMRLAQKDPARVIGITSPVAVGSQPARGAPHEWLWAGGDRQETVGRFPIPRFPPFLSQQPSCLEPIEDHALRGVCLLGLEEGRGPGTGWVLTRLHVRGSGVYLPGSQALPPFQEAVPGPLHAGHRGCVGGSDLSGSFDLTAREVAEDDLGGHLGVPALVR